VAITERRSREDIDRLADSLQAAIASSVDFVGLRRTNSTLVGEAGS
jgi:hypothetical protein